MLGAAYLAARTPLKAGAAYHTAARFGWRDPSLAQLFLMDQALRFGAIDLAAMRLDPVLRHDPDFPLRDMLLARLATSPQGRTELARRLARRPVWTERFMGEGSPLPLPALQNSVAVLMALESPLDCTTIAPLAKRLIEADDILRAHQLWRRHCTTASGEISDPGFTRAWSEVLTLFD